MVETEEGAEWTSKFPDWVFIEISAKMSPNIEDIFMQLLKQILRIEEMKAREPEPEPQAVVEEAPKDDSEKAKKKKKWFGVF